MATTACTSGHERKGRITILNAGNVASTSPVKELGVDDNANDPTKIYPQKAISSATANIGTTKPISAGVFNDQRDGEYVMPYMTTKIANVSNTTMRSPAGDHGQVRQQFAGDTRLNITSFSIHGTPTFGAARGDNVLASGINNVTGAAADLANAIPGNIYFMQGGRNPYEASLPTRNG